MVKCNCHAKGETAGDLITPVFSARKGHVLKQLRRLDSKAVAAFSQGGGFQPPARLECFFCVRQDTLSLGLGKAGHSEPKIKNVPGNREAPIVSRSCRLTKMVREAIFQTSKHL